MENSSTFYIAGQGSISSLCAIQAQQSQQPYQQICRDSKPKQAVQVSGNNKIVNLSEPIYLKEVKVIDKLLVPLKAFHIVDFIQEVKPYLRSGAHVVLSHNGLGTIEQVNDILPTDCHLYFCTTNNGAFKVGNTVTLAGTGQTYWSEINRTGTHVNQSSVSLTNKDFAMLFPNSQLHPDLKRVLWQKLLINCVINPLTAIHNVKNGALTQGQYQPQIASVIDEYLLITHKEGIEIDKSTALDLVITVCEQTAENTSSMLQDVLSGRATEIDYITGYLLKQAKKHQLYLPTCSDLFERVKSLSR